MNVRDNVATRRASRLPGVSLSLGEIRGYSHLRLSDS
jgi:hypothetical protein